MGKYNVGDKVRIISKRGSQWNPKGLMDKYCGTVMTIRDNHKFGSDGLYAMEEDKHENGGGGWCWDDSDIVGLVKDETPKYKVGDRVIVEESNVDFLFGSYCGKHGKIVAIMDCFDHPYQVAIDNDAELWCKVKCLESDNEAVEKIVITHDGKTTTATLYRDDGSKETATARCAPEDTFDFNVGAKLAMERLMEKVNPAVEPDEPTESDVEWRVVNRKAQVGDYIRLTTDGHYHWNEPGDVLKVDVVGTGTLVYVLGKHHIRNTDNPNFQWSYAGHEYEVVEKVNPVNIDGFKVGDKVRITGCTKDYTDHLDGKVGEVISVRDKDIEVKVDGDTRNWMIWKRNAEVVEAPKYYNGKVVCVSNKYPNRISCIGFTVGKIYEVKDGRVTNDDGWTCNNHYTTVKDLCQGLGNTFLGIVE